MRKSRSPRKHDKKKTKADPDLHPLNLPPDELRRLSAFMAQDAARASASMDTDKETPVANGASPPVTPAREAVGSFPEAQANGDASGVNGGHEEKSPTPPPHRVTPTPKVDAEACKAAGNKFFKAKDYERAIVEYTKGGTDPGVLLLHIC